jgi:hypothetical protein
VDAEEANGAGRRTAGDLTPAEVGRWDDRYGLLFLIIVASMLLTARQHEVAQGCCRR